MSAKVFLDTNILIYAHDRDAGAKRDTARALLRDIWERHVGVISTQVLQEFYVNVTRKIATPLSKAEARGVLRNYMLWQIESNAAETILAASEIEEHHQLSFWDALIIASAVRGGAERLLTEDLNHGQVIQGVQVQNPFFDS
jgi:predicted nucleic acid-binding protein